MGVTEKTRDSNHGIMLYMYIVNVITKEENHDKAFQFFIPKPNKTIKKHFVIFKIL